MGATRYHRRGRSGERARYMLSRQESAALGPSATDRPATREAAKRPSRVVRKRGFEPPRPCGHKLLRLARLPVPPLPHEGENTIGWKNQLYPERRPSVEEADDYFLRRRAGGASFDVAFGQARACMNPRACSRAGGLIISRSSSRNFLVCSVRARNSALRPASEARTFFKSVLACCTSETHAAPCVPNQHVSRQR